MDDLLFRDLSSTTDISGVYSATKSKHLGGDQENLDAGYDFCKWVATQWRSLNIYRVRARARICFKIVDVFWKLPQASLAAFDCGSGRALVANLAARSSYHAISKQIDIGSHPLVRQYVEILEGCYSILSTERFNANTKSGVLRKEKKIYFMDPLIMAALVTWAEKGEVDPSWIAAQWADPVQQGKWVENVVACELRKRQCRVFYDVQCGNEIDFVFAPPGKDQWQAIECKRSAPHPQEVRGLGQYPGAEIWVSERVAAQKAREDKRLEFPVFWTPERLLSFI